MNELSEAQQRYQRVSQLIAKCWADEAFKKKLLADPDGTLKANGVEPLEGRSFKLLEDSEKVVHLVIPRRPTDLTDEVLDGVVAGARSSSPCSCACTCSCG